MASTGHYIIAGIQDGLDTNATKELREVPLRMEIDEWFLSTELIHINQRALFFPAFWRFSQMDPHQKTSWFQIAGIHGKPYIAWDEAPQKGKTSNRGYCTHNSMLFATWHRPYLLLWEQVIYELMKDEANKYTDEKDRKELLEHAKSWRFPYWDWALKKPDPTTPGDKLDYTVPKVVDLETVQIRLPTGSGFGDCNNAFYRFQMPGKMTMGDKTLKSTDPLKSLAIIGESGQGYRIPFDQCNATSRCPQTGQASVDWVDGKQNNNQIAQSLRDYQWTEPRKDRPGNVTASLRDAFYRTLTIKEFEDFATKRAKPQTSGPSKQPHAYDSAEGIHDSLHGWCGGDAFFAGNGIVYEGHMSEVSVAAFDPIFWLHHCNIDRLIAIWQILHGDKWFGKQDDPRNQDLGNFFIETSHKDTSKDQLRPFFKSQTECYTSDDVRYVTKLGYTYGGLEKWKYTKADGTYDEASHVAALNETLNINYNSTWSAVEKAKLTADHGVHNMSLTMLKQTTEKEPVDLIGVPDYVVDVVYNKFALYGRRFTINIFIGKVPDHLPYSYQGSDGTDSLVGQVINFSSELPAGDDAPGCGNCRSQKAEDVLSTGKVVLSNALITRWKNQIVHTPDDPNAPAVLEGMEPNQVIEFLNHNLHWRVTSLGQLVDLNDMPDLKISFAIGKADHFADRTKMSEYYDYEGAYEVTHGRPGGASAEDGLYQ